MGCYVDSMADGISRWRMPGRPPSWDSPRERVPEPSLQAGKALTPGQKGSYYKKDRRLAQFFFEVGTN